MHHGIRDIADGTAVGHGLTLTTWASGTATLVQLGEPRLAAIALFIVGAGLAWLAVTALFSSTDEGRGWAPCPAWMNTQVVPSLCALTLVWQVNRLSMATLGWFLAGATAYGTFLAAAAIQRRALLCLAGEDARSVRGARARPLRGAE